MPSFQSIDDALEIYYQENGYHDYRDDDGCSQFMRFIINEQLNDVELPIETELGDNCDPSDCTYCWMYNNVDCKFPVPAGMDIPDQSMETYIFYVLQYCYKYNKPPTTQYIKEEILSKVAGASHGIESSNKDTTNRDEYETIEGVSNQAAVSVSRICKTTLKNENIISCENVSQLMNIIDEQFGDESVFNYISATAKLQMDEEQVNGYKILVGDKENTLAIVNYDFHLKATTIFLYGIIVPDYTSEKEGNSIWKLDTFLTSTQIFDKYQIEYAELPKSSRKISRFERELARQLVIEESLIDNTDWFNVRQIDNSVTVNEGKLAMISLDTNLWINECKKSFQDTDFPMIPVLISSQNKHWIEWIKIIHIKSQGFCVGVSLKYDDDNQCKVQSICLNKRDIYEKHRFVGFTDCAYTVQLNTFNKSISKIIFN